MLYCFRQEPDALVHEPDPDRADGGCYCQTVYGEVPMMTYLSILEKPRTAVQEAKLQKPPVWLGPAAWECQ